MIIRFFNTVGPRQAGTGSAPSRGSSGRPGPASRSPSSAPVEQIRCFCHVGDVVPALLKGDHHQAAYGLALNLGNTEQVSISELAKRVIATTGSASEIRHMSYLDAMGPGYEDMQRRVPDGLARELIGFTPTRTLDDIIRSVIADQTQRRVRGTINPGRRSMGQDTTGIPRAWGLHGCGAGARATVAQGTAGA